MNENQDTPQNESSPAGDPDIAAFDDLLSRAMKARPEPAAPQDLAKRAMALATADETVRLTQHTLQLARQRRWAQIASIAAALLIVAMLAGAARRMWIRGDIAAIASSSDTSQSTTSDDGTSTSAEAATDTSTSGTAGTVAVVFVAELLVLGVVLMSISRRAPTMPWGAEALAGFW